MIDEPPIYGGAPSPTGSPRRRRTAPFTATEVRELVIAAQDRLLYLGDNLDSADYDPPPEARRRMERQRRALLSALRKLSNVAA